MVGGFGSVSVSRESFPSAADVRGDVAGPAARPSKGEADCDGADFRSGAVACCGGCEDELDAASSLGLEASG